MAPTTTKNERETVAVAVKRGDLPTVARSRSRNRVSRTPPSSGDLALRPREPERRNYRQSQCRIREDG